MNFPNVPAIHGEAIAGRSAKVRQVLQKLVDKIDENTFDVAELLAEAKSSGYFYSWGYASLWEYAREELDLKERKARYLTRIVYVCREVGISRTTYELAGISKLREITRLNPKDFWFNPETKTNEPNRTWITEQISHPENWTTAKLKAEVDKRLSLVGDDSLIWIPAFQVKKSVLEKVILPAQELARRLLGSAGKDEDGMAIEYSRGVVEEIIHADFLVGNQGELDAQQSSESSESEAGANGSSAGDEGDPSNSSGATAAELASGQDAQDEPRG